VPNASYLARRAYYRGRTAAAVLAGRRRRWRGIRILGYHRLAPNTEPLSVSPKEFRAQMHAVRASGATPIRLAEALRLLETPVEGRYVCITFDDGYADNIEHGEPVLREFEIPATIFVPTAVIDGRCTYFWYKTAPPALSWDEIRAASSAGIIDFQSHTATHRWLPELTHDEALAEFRESRARLESELGSAPSSIAFPSGLYGSREVELVRATGYRAGITTNPGINHGAAPLAELRRTLVFGEDDATLFGAKLIGLFDPAEAIAGAQAGRPKDSSRRGRQ
jgi:peptidoglycan/xylan/chitin deacetylase (PgdA/CDA1 family)